MSSRAPATAVRGAASRRLVSWCAWLAPPFLAALWAGAITIPGGSFEPWAPGMIDLEVYHRAATDLLGGRDFYEAEGQLPWIYPPFAALLALPVALLGLQWSQYLWLLTNAGVVLAMMYRLGLSGWRMSLAATAAIWLVDPVRETLGFGQLGIFLVGAAVLDSLPGRRLLPRRVLPEGWLVGVVTAVKLTPATVAAANFFAGRRRPGLVAFATFCVATAGTALLLPRASLAYWGGLLRGDSGINNGIIYKTNQSVMGVWGRLFGELSRGGLLVSALVLVAGIAAAALLMRAGEPQLGVCLAGYTSLLASPISWSHHYVWVVPLVVVLITHEELPKLLRLWGLFYAIWTAQAPFKALPGGDNRELAYGPWHQVMANAGVVAGVVFLAMALFYGIALARARRASGVVTGVVQ